MKSTIELGKFGISSDSRDIIDLRDGGASDSDQTTIKEGTR
jgi:hypothetical protein